MILIIGLVVGFVIGMPIGMLFEDYFNIVRWKDTGVEEEKEEITQLPNTNIY